VTKIFEENAFLAGAFALAWQVTTIGPEDRDVKKRSVAFYHGESQIGPHRTRAARGPFSVREAVKR